MATFSLCMIVKNEEKVLARCLDSVADLMDEIIIVDTGSCDATKEIAARYTDKIYDFEWIGDFAAARNFSFEQATMDYIYAPDADEVLDEANHEELAKLKQVILPEIEIVQMKYATVTEYNTVLNAATEYRPKLFKRVRNFTWVDPIHETVRLDPVVFDSDIVIHHMPEQMHSKRDFSIFEKTIAKDGALSDKLMKMYAMELMKTGDVADLQQAFLWFEQVYATTDNPRHREYAACVLAKHYRLQQDGYGLLKVALKEVATTPCSEICYELGQYYLDLDDLREASLWFMNALSETEAALDVHAGGDSALQELKQCYERLLQQNLSEEEKCYFEEQLRETQEAITLWRLPEE
ncbi:MAG: glycosyltransferase family 2 protein [Lachnospiraceae bacterium]|nr:glycosyltransferase family 2 protein [Lachnospiraceae bacterium]